MQSLEFLLEYDRAKTATTYGQKLLAVAAKDRWLINEIVGQFPEGMSFQEMTKRHPDQLLDLILSYIERGDPTQHKEYAQSIAKMYSNGLSKMEDIVSTLADYLTKFDKLKRKKKIQPPRNDFNRYRSLEDFYDVVDEYPDEVEAAPEVKQNATELYRDKSLIVLIPNDVEAACYYGQGTRWCTAGKNNNMYSYYTKGERPLYIVIPRQQAYPGEKYQFHFETRQFMNEQDRQIGADGMAKLVERFPILKKILQKPAEKYNIQPLISDEYKAIVREATPEVAKEAQAMVEQYKQRIIGFGFKSLGEYGVKLPDGAQQQIAAALSDYIDQVLQNMGGVYEKLIANPGSECQNDFVESTVSADPKLQAIAKKSDALRLTIEAIQASGQKLHKDAIPHVTDLVVREPMGRFLMNAIPKFYRAKLQAQGHAL